MYDEIKKDELIWNSIFAPVVTGVPPLYAARNMSVCADGEIRHYGIKEFQGEIRRVYIASKDMGLTWKMYFAEPDDCGFTMVKCPWADYRLTVFDDGTNLKAYRSRKGPGFPPDIVAEINLTRKEPRPLLPLISRKRWIAPISDVACLNGTCYHAGALYSDDDGSTWTYAAVPEVPDVERQFACDSHPHWFNNGCEPSIAELADGVLLMALRTSGEYAAFTRSYDGGASWEVPKPCPGFWQANTMPELHTLKDGRLLFIWNNTAMLPVRPAEEAPELGKDELSGRWERVFTNRDALHAAISEDQGKTWIGFREVLLNEIRNDPDFRELGNYADQEHDKSVHQTQTLELPNGKILLAAGQNSAARKLLIFDPAWLYETSRKEDFRHGLANISHHLYVKSVNGGWRGWAGHCAWNRVPGVVMAREPQDNGQPVSVRESLWLCRVPDERLVSTRAGFTWNFPAARHGKAEMDFRVEGCGFQAALQDHWSNPCDEYLAPRSFIVFPVDEKNFARRSQWLTLSVEWDVQKGTAVIRCGGMSKEMPLKTDGFSASGPSYLHIQTLAEREDMQGTFFRELRMETLK